MKNLKQKHSSQDLSINEALILQQINEDGADDAVMLAHQAGFTRRLTMKIISNLRDKKLISIKSGWVSLTSKGRKLVRELWPEAVFAF